MSDGTQKTKFKHSPEGLPIAIGMFKFCYVRFMLILNKFKIFRAKYSQK